MGIGMLETAERPVWVGHWLPEALDPCSLQFSLGLSAAELCRPMLVCPLQGIGGVQGKECFLRVTSAHLFEVELQAARTLERLELQSLVAAELESETGTGGEPVSEVSCGVRCLGRGSPESSLGTCWLLCAMHWAWVFSIFSHENSVPRRSMCRAVVCHLGGWAKGWTLCKGFVSTPALWGPEFLFSSVLRVAQTPFPLPTAVFSFLPA